MRESPSPVMTANEMHSTMPASWRHHAPSKDTPYTALSWLLACLYAANTTLARAPTTLGCEEKDARRTERVDKLKKKLEIMPENAVKFCAGVQ